MNKQSIDVSGEWATNFKKLVLYQFNGDVIGRYELRDGVIKGTLKDNVLTGIWVQNRSLADCNYGPFKLTFTNDSFEGVYGFCDELSSRIWSGRKIKK